MPGTELSYFESLYRDNDDPWSMRTRWYEQRKRALVLASLPHRHYGRVFEPGCGTGDLTLELAPRCDALLASDFSADALGLARRRLMAFPHVKLDQGAMPRDWPQEKFDLVVLSEFAFYLDDSDLAALQRKALVSLNVRGAILACHWRRPFAERTQASEKIHGWFDQQAQLTRVMHHEEADFLLDVWSNSASSVAQQEGFA